LLFPFSLPRNLKGKLLPASGTGFGCLLPFLFTGSSFTEKLWGALFFLQRARGEISTFYGTAFNRPRGSALFLLDLNLSTGVFFPFFSWRVHFLIPSSRFVAGIPSFFCEGGNLVRQLLFSSEAFRRMRASYTQSTFFFTVEPRCCFIPFFPFCNRGRLANEGVFFFEDDKALMASSTALPVPLTCWVGTPQLAFAFFFRDECR